jgi:FkbM family methyltransferase
MNPRIHAITLAVARALIGVRVRGIGRAFKIGSPAILGTGPQLVECADGFRLVADPSDPMSAMLIYGRYSQDIVSVMRALVRRGDRVIDVGAHIGFISSHLAQLVGPGGAVYGLEPDPVARSRLTTGMNSNGFSWVQVLEVAASDSVGRIQFQAHASLGSSTAVVLSNGPGVKIIEVECSPIDGLVDEGRITGPISFVKMDVEGYECAVLDGMKRMLVTDRPVVLTEVNPGMLRLAGKSTLELFARFTALDYQIYGIAPPAGVLSRSRSARLSPLNTTVEADFCDALCVPRELAAGSEVLNRLR